MVSNIYEGLSELKLFRVNISVFLISYEYWK